MSPFMSTVTPVGLCSCPGDLPLTPKRILNWPSLENTCNQFHQRAPLSEMCHDHRTTFTCSMWPQRHAWVRLHAFSSLCLSHLYALVVAVSHHHSAVTRSWDSLQICELSLFSAAGTWQINNYTFSKCAILDFHPCLIVYYIFLKAHTSGFGQKKWYIYCDADHFSKYSCGFSIDFLSSGQMQILVHVITGQKWTLKTWKTCMIGNPSQWQWCTFIYLWKLHYLRMAGTLWQHPYLFSAFDLLTPFFSGCHHLYQVTASWFSFCSLLAWSENSSC